METRRITLTVDVETTYRTPDEIVANWRKMTKDQLIDQLCVYHEGLAEATAVPDAGPATIEDASTSTDTDA